MCVCVYLCVSWCVVRLLFWKWHIANPLNKNTNNARNRLAQMPSLAQGESSHLYTVHVEDALPFQLCLNTCRMKRREVVEVDTEGEKEETFSDPILQQNG